jgi:multicomponent Na+:H+ antiporter subunit B
VSRSFRIMLFLVGAAGLGFVLVWGFVGLPSFGDYPGPYGDLISNLAKPQRHIANAVTAIVFDYRGFDTMGEELILFAAATATAMLLRDTREHDTSDIVDAVRSDATRAAGLLAAIAALVLGLQVVAHGFITPGGGFQGGVVLAAAFALVFASAEYHGFHRLAPAAFAEPLEAFGAGAYVCLGIAALGLGLSFLENFLPLGTFGRLTSGGSAVLVNWSSGLAVAGGFLVVFGEYLQENMAARWARKEGA